MFSSRDLVAEYGVNLRTAEAYLFNNNKKGYITRLKRGLYAFFDHKPDDFIIANKLYFPSYISLDTALSYHDIIPESVYSITSVTTKSTREFEAFNLNFSYKKIKKQAFTGYIPQKILGHIVYIATPEKALADFLYFIHLGKRDFNERLNIKKIDKVKLNEYLTLFSKSTLKFAKKRLKEYAR